MNRFLNYVAFLAIFMIAGAPLIGAQENWTTAIAQGPGINTYWTTSGCVFNPNPAPVDVVFAFLPWGSDNTDPANVVSKTLPVGEQLCYENWVADLFGLGETTGAVLATSDKELFVGTRTWTDSSNGTYGQFIPGVTGGSVLPANTDVFLAGATDTDDFRTNLGMLNVSRENIAVTITVYGNDGVELNSIIDYLRPWEGKQRTRVLNQLGVAPLEGAYIKLVSTGEFLAYLSIVDNNTGDPTYVSGRTAPTDDVVYVPASARTPGAYETQWYTGANILNTTASSVALTVEYWERTVPGTNPTSVVINVPAHGQLMYTDLLSEVFGVDEGAAALRISGATGVRINTRTYNLGESGTFGQFIPAIPASEGLVDGQKGFLILVEEDGSFRTNLGLVNVGNSPVNVNAVLKATDGTVLGTHMYTVTPFTYVQVNNVVNDFTANTVSQAYLEFELASGDGPVLMYGSKVDNISGDPIYESLKLYVPETPMPVIDIFTATPTSCQYPGCDVNFSWDVSNAISGAVVCEDGWSRDLVDSDFPVGNTEHFFGASTSCTLTASNTEGSSTSTPVTITVGDCLAAVFVEGSVTPDHGTWPLAVTATATWQNADTVEYSFDNQVSWSTTNTHTFTSAGTFPVYSRALYCDVEVSEAVLLDNVTVSAPCTTPAYQGDGNVSPNSGDVGEMFTGYATFTGDVDSIEWNWGDGSGWTTASSHSYNSAGNFEVNVRANGCSETVGPYTVETVTVSDPCTTPSYNSGNVSPNSGTTGVTNFGFTSSWSGDVDTIEYDPGDGSGFSTSTSHVYGTAGNYTVRVRAFGCGGWVGPYNIETVTVSDPCEPFVITNAYSGPSSGIAPLPVTAYVEWTGTAPATITVDWGDGTDPTVTNGVSGSPFHVEHTYTTTGVFFVNVSGSNACGSDSATAGAVSVF